MPIESLPFESQSPLIGVLFVPGGANVKVCPGPALFEPRIVNWPVVEL